MKNNYNLQRCLKNFSSFKKKAHQQCSTNSIYFYAVLFIFFATNLNAQINNTYNFNTDLQGWSTQGYGTFNQSTIQGCGGGASARANVFDDTGNNFLSPLLGTANTNLVTITFDYKVVNYAALDQAQASTVEIIAQWSNSVSGPWTNFFTINSTNHTPSNACVSRTATFTPTAGNLYVKFQNRALGGSADIFYYYDNIVVTQTQLGNASQPMNGLSYYPNPVQDQLTINYSQDISSVTVFNLVGQKVMTASPNTSNVVLDMSKLSAGTYMIQVNANETSKMIKFIKS